ncbi:hypothetical protein F4680DRAFT_463755 [Xylaria scruposa]|nr:hypothetical protein F4680DRAFT_463755 [Xylaria scruposa]
MIPVIFLIGLAGSGKGTLGPGLASRFNLHHISLGATFRRLSRMRHNPIPGMSEEINKYLENQDVIPESVLAQFKPGPIPAVLQLHNCRTTSSDEAHLCGEMVREITAELMSRSVVPRAIVIDGLQMAFQSDTDFGQVLQDIAPLFSGLTIKIRCFESVALKRYIRRNRSGNSDIKSFGSRLKSYHKWEPIFLDFLGNKGVVIETTNDYAMTVDEAVQTLVNNIETVPQWRSLIDCRSGPMESQIVACSEDISDSDDTKQSSHETQTDEDSSQYQTDEDSSQYQTDEDSSQHTDGSQSSQTDEKQAPKTVKYSEDIVDSNDSKSSSNESVHTQGSRTL